MLRTEVIRDIAETKAEVNKGIETLRAAVTKDIVETKAELAGDIAETRLEFNRMIEKSRSSTVRWTISLLVAFGLVNVGTILGAMFTLARLLTSGSP